MDQWLALLPGRVRVVGVGRNRGRKALATLLSLIDEWYDLDPNVGTKDPSEEGRIRGL